MVIRKKWLPFAIKIFPPQIIVFGFALLILFGALLLNLPFASRSGESIGFLNALFTSTSATCVTGLVVVDTYTHWTLFGQLVILCLIQIGGLGFMTVVTLLSFVVGRRITVRERLLMQESFNNGGIEGIVRLTKHVLVGTLVIEGIGAVILSTQFVQDFGFLGGVYKGIFHAVSAFCNAGIDLMGEIEPFTSLTPYVGNTLVNITIMGLIILGGLGFAVWEDVYHAKNFRSLRVQTKLVLAITALLILSGFVLIFLFEHNNPATLGRLSIKDQLLASLFHSVTPRTAGFNTLDMVGLTDPTKVLTVLFMFIGGSPGSTAGGIKTVTAGILIFALLSVVKGERDVSIMKRRVPSPVVFRSIGILMIGLIIVFVGTLLLTVTQGGDFISLLLEETSAFGTVGLSAGITPHLTATSKVIVLLTMFLGRVGGMTMVVAFVMKSVGNERNYKYPEAKIFVG